jgi:hypothetical protein
MTRRQIGTDERRARLGLRHRLAPGTQAASVAEAAESMVALHATDAASVYLEARARIAASSPSTIEHELYEERSVLRLIAMRRTLFLVPVADVPIVHAAASRAVGERERRRTIAMLAEGGIGPDPATLLEQLEEIALATIRERGEATTAEVRAADPLLAQRITLARGKSYEGSISLATRAVFHLALDGRIARGRPRGTWIAGQFRWSPIEGWLPDGIPPLPVEVARAELAMRWLRTFGPGTRDDLRWWTGWTAAATRQALEAAGAVAVEVDDGATGHVLPDDLDPVESPEHWVALLPALDATTMGWTDRDWYLGPHRPRLFDSSGNAGPTIWVDGRVVGGWAQRRIGEVVPFLLEDPGAEVRHAIDEEAARLEAWIGPARVSGSFPTPLEIELREPRDGGP